MSVKPRMLITGVTHNPGGKESFIMASFLALKDQYEIFFLSDRQDLAYETFLRRNGAKIIRVRPRSESPLGHYGDLRAVFQRNSFDVLWCHQSVLNTLAPASFARRAGVPIRIIHSHATQNLGTRVAALLHPVNKRRVASVANRHFACSTDAARWMFGDGPSTIVPNAFDTASFAFDSQVRLAARDELGIASGTLVIAHVARFGEEKNHQLTIEVTRLARDGGTDVRALLIGDGAGRAQIEELVRGAGLEDQVSFLGLRTDVPTLLQASDVLVLPSAHEGLPYSVLEAQAASLPAVVSDRVPAEIDVTDGVSFVPFTAPADVWLQEIIKRSSTRRVEGHRPLIGTAYDSSALPATIAAAINRPGRSEMDVDGR